MCLLFCDSHSTHDFNRRSFLLNAFDPGSHACGPSHNGKYIDFLVAINHLIYLSFAYIVLILDILYCSYVAQMLAKYQNDIGKTKLVVAIIILANDFCCIGNVLVDREPAMACMISRAYLAAGPPGGTIPAATAATWLDNGLGAHTC